MEIQLPDQLHIWVSTAFYRVQGCGQKPSIPQPMALNAADSHLLLEQCSHYNLLRPKDALFRRSRYRVLLKMRCGAGCKSRMTNLKRTFVTLAKQSREAGRTL
jgi:hypothetical protein